MFPVKESVSQFVSHCGYTLGIRTICVDADVLTVQNDCVVTEQVVAIPDVFELCGSPGNDFFRIAGLVAANYSIGHINSACVQGRLLSSGVISVLTADIFLE